MEGSSSGEITTPETALVTDTSLPSRLAVSTAESNHSIYGVTEGVSGRNVPAKVHRTQSIFNVPASDLVASGYPLRYSTTRPVLESISLWFGGCSEGEVGE